MNAETNRTPRIRVLALTVLILGSAALLYAFREPLLDWFFPNREKGAAVHDRGATQAAGLPCSDLPEGALEPLRTAFAAYEEIRSSLAADRLGGVSPHAHRLAGSLGEARGTLGSGELAGALEDAEHAAHALGGARDLKSARESFGEVSETVISLAACQPGLAKGWHLYECPMESGYNKWLQRPAKAQNPFMGQAMLTCAVPAEWPGSQAGHVYPTAGEISHYTCPMHPSVRQSGPGQCPICGMDLVPVTQEQAASGELVIGHDRLQTIGFQSGLVERVPVRSEIRAVGRVAFDETRYEDVTVKFGGYIERLHVEETGRPVRRGQTLFTLYSPELYAAQREYLTALASQQAARSTGAPDRADYLVDAARQKLRLWDLSEAQIQAIAEKGEPVRAIPVLSPASGYVMEKDVVQGGAVQPGMRLFRIAALDRVWVEAEVYESELPRVKTGQRAVVTLPFQPGEELRGRVSLVYPALNPETRTGMVRIEVPNRTGAGGPVLKPDMYADVVLQAADREILAVPASAVLYTGPRRLVFLDLGEGRFRQKEVRLGSKVGDAFEVLAGLEEGDRVVTSGNFLIDAESRLRSGGRASDEQHVH